LVLAIGQWCFFFGFRASFFEFEIYLVLPFRISSLRLRICNFFGSDTKSEAWTPNVRGEIRRSNEATKRYSPLRRCSVANAARNSHKAPRTKSQEPNKIQIRNQQISNNYGLSAVSYRL
jgi:hypothetical protein